MQKLLKQIIESFRYKQNKRYTIFHEMWSWGIKKDGISQGTWFHTKKAAEAYCEKMNNE